LKIIDLSCSSKICVFQEALNRCTVSAFYNSLILLTYQSWKAAVKVGIHISEKKDYLECAGGCTPSGEVELKNKGSWFTFFLDGLN